MTGNPTCHTAEIHLTAAIEAHKHALGLISDAEVLLDVGRYPTAFALAILALEEFSKSFLLKAAASGIVTETNVEVALRKRTSHEDKIFHGIHLLVLPTVDYLQRKNLLAAVDRDKTEPDHSKHIAPAVVEEWFPLPSPKKRAEALTFLFSLVDRAHEKKLKALYVDIEGNRVVTPELEVNPDQTRELVGFLAAYLEGFDIILSEEPDHFKRLAALADPDILRGFIHVQSKQKATTG